jgi:hypothetical protein
MDKRVLFKSLVIGLLCAAFSGAVLGDDKLILAQKVELKVVDGNSTYVGVGTGPFTDRFPNGIDASGNVANQQAGKPAPATDLTQGRIPPGATVKREFGSIGASQGSIIQNSSGKDVKEIEVTTKGKDAANNDNTIDANSKDGADFDTTIAGKTITFKAKAGKELKPNQRIWMLIPEGPQPGTPGNKIYEGKVTTALLVPPPQPGFDRPTQVAAVSETATVSLGINGALKTLSFTAGAIDFTRYGDGSTSSSPALDFTVGSQMAIGDMAILGPSSLSGAFELSDSGISLTQNGRVIFQGELVNGLLIPDPQRSGWAHIQARFGFFEEGSALPGSRFMQEHFGEAAEGGFFIDADLLLATNGLAVPGTGQGIALVAGVIPEPPSAALMGLGLALIAGRVLRSRRAS